MNQMEGGICYKYGDPLDGSVLGVRKDLRIPEPGNNEIQIKVHCASLNPVDYKLIEGYLKPLYKPLFPYVPGMDFSGEIIKIGKGCLKFRVGDQVMGKSNDGAIAQYIVTTEERVTLRPHNLSWEESAGLPLAGMTALQAVEECRIPQGGKILIIGGSSSVGSMAIQVAKHEGLFVISTCSARNIELVKRVGANLVIDRGTCDWSEVLSKPDTKVDGVLDCVGENNAYKRSKRVMLSVRNCRFVTIAEGVTQKQGVTGMVMHTLKTSWRKLLGHPPYTWMWLEEKRKSDGTSLIERIRELSQSGRLRPVIDSTWNLDSIHDAFAKVKSGHAAGKVIIQIPQQQRTVPPTAEVSSTIEGPSQ